MYNEYLEKMIDKCHITNPNEPLLGLLVYHGLVASDAATLKRHLINHNVFNIDLDSLLELDMSKSE